ncbi:MAG: hypothetical protein IJ081_00835 [Prevotella sp.]|nr:hypothetical protein [Prevotella sp.]
MNETNPFAGTIEFNWPGKHCELHFNNGKWQLTPYNKKVVKRALIFDSQIGEGNDVLGYSIKGDIISALDSLHSFVPSSVQLVYLDAPRLSVFQSVSESGYSTSTWLSLIQQSAMKAIPCMSRMGFFALHTDEEMAHYARIVLEEIFGKNNYVGTFAWQKQYAPQNDNAVPTDVLDYITVFSKSPVEELPRIGLLVTPKDLKDDGDFRGCYIDGHKGARSGSEATKFKINTSPYHWEIIDSNLPDGRYYFDRILGSLWFESVDSIGDFFVKVKATDKNGNTAEKVINFSVRERTSIDDVYQLPQRIWWLMKNDNDIVKGGQLQVSDLPSEQLTGIKGQEFSLVLKAEGGEPITMRSDSPGAGRYWEFGLRTLIEGIARAKASFGGTGVALPSIKKYFSREDAKKIQAVMNFLPWYDFGHTQDATQHCKALKNAHITEGEINMTAKPQKLLAHIFSLLAPSKKDIVLALGDSNCVFSGVAIKLQKPFIHITGASEDNLSTWEETGSKRLKGVIDGLDTEDIEGNDALPETKNKIGRIDVLRLSDSYLVHNQKNGDIEPFFDDSEDAEAFYAGLAGAYRQLPEQNAYTGIDNRIVVVVPEEESLDNVLLDSYKSKYKTGKLIVVYESNDESFTSMKNVTLKRAPFDLMI